MPSGVSRRLKPLKLDGISQRLKRCATQKRCGGQKRCTGQKSCAPKPHPNKMRVVKLIDRNLRKGGQFYQVIVGNTLDGVAGFAPGSKAARYDINFES
jgi:hypothetical protein